MKKYLMIIIIITFSVAALIGGEEKKGCMEGDNAFCTYKNPLECIHGTVLDKCPSKGLKAECKGTYGHIFYYTVTEKDKDNCINNLDGKFITK